MADGASEDTAPASAGSGEGSTETYCCVKETDGNRDGSDDNATTIVGYSDSDCKNDDESKRSIHGHLLLISESIAVGVEDTIPNISHSPDI